MYAQLSPVPPLADPVALAGVDSTQYAGASGDALAPPAFSRSTRQRLVNIVNSVVFYGILLAGMLIPVLGGIYATLRN